MISLYICMMTGSITIQIMKSGTDFSSLELSWIQHLSSLCLRHCSPLGAGWGKEGNIRTLFEATSSCPIYQSLQSLFPSPSARVQPENESSQRLSPWTEWWMTCFMVLFLQSWGILKFFNMLTDMKISRVFGLQPRKITTILQISK